MKNNNYSIDNVVIVYSAAQQPIGAHGAIRINTGAFPHSIISLQQLFELSKTVVYRKEENFEKTAEPARGNRRDADDRIGCPVSSMRGDHLPDRITVTAFTRRFALRTAAGQSTMDSGLNRGPVGIRGVKDDD